MWNYYYPPSVTYRITLPNGEVLETSNPHEIPSTKKIEELLIELQINTPEEYLGSITRLYQEKRGIFQSQEWKPGNLYQLNYHLPLAEFMVDFHDKMKSISSGYASFNYWIIGFVPSPIVKVDILLNNQIIPDLSFLVHQDFAYLRAKVICENLKKTLIPKLLLCQFRLVSENK